jgi:hypothetical protein
MVNELFSKFVQLRKCGESSYLSIAEKNPGLNKISAVGDFSKLNTHSKNGVRWACLFPRAPPFPRPKIGYKDMTVTSTTARVMTWPELSETKISR